MKTTLKTSRAVLRIAVAGLLLCSGSAMAQSTPVPLTTLTYRVLGTQLRVSPAALSVPKGIPGSILAEVANADGSTNVSTAQLGAGAYIEAILRGPSFDARRLVGQPNTPLMLPPLNLVGDYQIDNIRLVDSVTGATRMEGSPASVPVHVFDQVLISQVTSRPLTTDEIQEKGIYIDEQNFRAVEFEVAFVLDGKTIPVKMPVVAPTFKQSTELIPAAELESKLLEARIINSQIAAGVELPKELQTAGLNIQVQGINFQKVDMDDKEDGFGIPPIPALMVIPGNIGYLNQFFSVQIFTENGAPSGSGLSVNNVMAHLILPPGPDQIASTNWAQPGDDPLRFARIGPDKIIQPIQQIMRPGADGKLGTVDDIPRLYPGESGQAEFLVEGLQEGLHVMNVDLTADLEGLKAGVVKISGKAAGSVLVRNPKFSMAFTHPRTVRAGEPYTASVTILNTSAAMANMVSVTLARNSISGGDLESDATVQLGTILPGQSATANYRVRAQRTGSVSFSNLTTGDDSVQGRFLLTMGIDERGVALSPDAIGMPGYVTNLPPAILTAANRVLGQALSAATAPLLPAGVRRVSRSIITTRVLELAEAGQRLQYGDGSGRVLADLLLDWQGGRKYDDGFDQILRTTNAGQEWRAAFAGALEFADGQDATARFVQRAPDIAGRSEPWVLSSLSVSAGSMTFTADAGDVSADNSALPRSLIYAGSNGWWLAGASASNAVVRWFFTNAVPQAELGVWVMGTNGTARQFRWSLSAVPAGACYQVALADPTGQLAMDTNCDGATDDSLLATQTTVQERAPELVAALQDTQVYVGRPNPHCLNPDVNNYGTVLAVLFSKPMTQSSVNIPAAYQFDNGNVGRSVQIQPGGRVALVNMRFGFSALRPRLLTINGVTDPRGNPLNVVGRPIATTLVEGVSVKGRVVKADGSPAIGVPVTLTMCDQLHTPMLDCVPFIVRAAQVFTDANGSFYFDFVLAGVPYTVSATDTSGLTPEAVQVLLDSAVAGQTDRQRLLDLANSPDVQNTLLAAFAVGALPEAIVKVEGLDRAVLRDSVGVGSPRMGTETVMALRFRGRGTVTGQILAADGVTPVYQTAVNLFPDPDSRELGRGMYSDINGRFAFYGVPLGLFTVDATSPTGQSRTVADLLDQVGQTNEVIIVLSTNQVLARGGIQGRVVEADNTTPHPGAQVYVGYDVRTILGTTTADANGYWSVTNLPVGSYMAAAISLDGKRSGQRDRISVTPGVSAQVTVALLGTATVRGRVETAAGAPVTNALVAGGEMLVRSDANGMFTLTGVPTGSRSVSVGLERNPAAGINFPRFGSSSLTVLQGVDNYVVVKLVPAGSIVGRVLDVQGKPVPNARVAIPVSEGFFWVDADANGHYVFENMALGGYTLSSPSPEVAQTDTSALMNQILSGDQDQIRAAVEQAYAIFTGVNDPYLNGQGASFNPRTWGYTRTSLDVDGQTVVADIQYLPQGAVSGTVINGQGVPIGARVRLTGLGPSPNGAPGIIKRGELNSDPATGLFLFSGLYVGPWGLQAASPFYPTIISTGGQTTFMDPVVTNIVLQFPPVREVNGRLAGYVFYPDGTPAGSNVQVHIDFSADYMIRTDTNGFFDTQITIPARGYSAEAFDPLTGLRGKASVLLTAGITNYVDIHLLGKGSLAILVTQANGAPATNAAVEVVQGSYPGDHYSGVTATNGVLQLNNLFEGTYAVSASYVIATTTVSGRSGASVQRDQTNAVTVRVAATGAVHGRFVQRDLVTPVGYAQVSIGTVGFAPTDGDGYFSLAALPLGTYRIVAQDPVSGIGATANATIGYDGQTVEVLLVAQSRGEINGVVINSYGNGFVSGASVTLNVSDGMSPSRTVTTGPDGAFSFPGAPAGTFSLSAHDPVTKLSGSAGGVLPENTPSLSVSIAIQPLGNITGQVFLPDGITPATNAAVTVGWYASDTDANGRVSFVDVPLGYYNVRAKALAQAETRSIGFASTSLKSAGATATFTVTLSGVGRVAGRVLNSDGVTPAIGVEVDLVLDGSSFRGAAATALCGLDGSFDFDNLPIGPYRLIAQEAALAATFNGVIYSNAQADAAQLVLGSSGAVIGRLVRADQTTPAAGISIVLSFNSQSTAPGNALATTAPDGTFGFFNVPLGPVSLEAVAPSFAGISRVRSSLTANGQTNNLGTVLLDEADPFVVSVTPAPLAVNVPTTTPIDLLFSEAIDTNTVNPGGIFLRYGTNPVPATVQLLPDPTNAIYRLVRLTPATRLLSQKTYDVIVISGTWLDAFGNKRQGPLDLVGRPIPAPFTSRFTTADNDPPVLVSIFPSNAAVQIDPVSVMRLSFNESIRDSNYTFTVTGPGGPIAGTSAVGLNGLVMTFTPTAALLPNATYTLQVDGVRDLAGNLATNQPFTATFNTVDTLGPTIASLGLAAGRSPVAGATVPVQADLAAAEPGVSVRFTQDFAPVGVATNPPYQVNVTLPSSGSTTMRAIATDRYGNDGPLAEVVLTVVSNQAPTVTLVRSDAAGTTVTNGQTVIFRVSAADDDAVTNLTLVGLGAGSFAATYRDGQVRSVPVTISNTAPAGATLQFIARATDSVGQKSSTVEVDLTVIDTVPPTLTLLNPASNALLDPGQPLALSVAASDNSTNYHLQLVVSGALFLTQQVEVATLPNVTNTNTFTVPLDGVTFDGHGLTVVVQASDQATNSTQVSRSFRLPDRTPPVVSLSRVDAGGALVPSGLSFTLSVGASDFGGVTNLNVQAAGAMSWAAAYANGSTRSPSFTVPTNCPPGTNILFTAQATDSSGNQSALQQLQFTVTDGTPPALSLLMPQPGTMLDPAQPLNLTVVSWDNSAAYDLALAVSGALVATQHLAVTAAPNALATNVLVVPLTGAILDGRGLTVSLRATDAALNVTQQSWSFGLPDRQPPFLTTITPADGAARQSLWLSQIRLQFSERVATNTVSTNSILVTNSIGGTVAYQVAVTPDATAAVIQLPSLPLAPGKSYTCRILPQITDLAGNALAADTNGTPLPADGRAATFTTAAILGVTPTNGTTVVAGDWLSVKVDYESGFGAGFFRFQFDTNPPVIVGARAAETIAQVPLPANAVSGPLHISASLDAAFTQPLVLPDVSLAVIQAPPLTNGLVQWPLSAGGNGHWYEVVAAGTNLTWADARSNAVAKGGYLACITSEAENNFVFGLADRPEYWTQRTWGYEGPWLGGSFSQPAGWSWISPEPWSYTHWWPGEPDNSSGSDDSLAFGTGLDANPPRQPYWSDVSHADLNPAYVVEYDGLPATAGYDPRKDFTTNGNPNSVWSYAWAASLGDAPQLLDYVGAPFVDAPLVTLRGNSGWYNTQWPDACIVAANAGSSTYSVNNQRFQPDVLLLDPQAHAVMVRFTAPVAGNYKAQGLFRLLDTAPHGHYVQVRQNSTNVVFTQDTTGGASGAEYSFDLGSPYLNVSDTLDFVVSVKGQDWSGLSTGLKASVVPAFTNTSSAPLVFSAPAGVTLLAGQSSNVVVQVNANAPVVQADFPPSKLPPAFVSVLSRTLRVLGTNGQANVTLQMNPLHDAVGTYVVALQAAAQNGVSGVIEIPVTVLPNPALAVTRWTNAVSGNWSDASKWSAGLPSTGVVAVIDAVGTYTVTLDTSVAASGIVLNHSNAVLNFSGTRTIDAPVEVRAGQFVFSSGTLTLNQALVNQGTIRWSSGNTTVALQGAGCVKNLGVWTTADVGAYSYNPSLVRVPVEVLGGGLLKLDTNARLTFGAGSSLTLASTAQILGGAHLALDNSSPARDLRYLPGAAVIGTGSIDVAGASRLIATGDLDSPACINLYDTAQALVPGTCFLGANSSVSGTLQAAAVLLRTNTTLNLANAAVTGALDVQSGGQVLINGNATFGSNVLVEAGATWVMNNNNSPTVTLNGVLTNLGTIRGYSGNRNYTLRGSGRVEHLGLWTTADTGAYYYYESWVLVPVNMPAGSTLSLDTNSRMAFGSGSSLAVAGALQIGANARLRLDNSSPSRTVTFRAGSSLAGTGTLELDGDNQLVAEADLVAPVSVNTYDTAGVVVAGAYTIGGKPSVSGTLQAGAVTVLTNATLNLANATVSGPVDVQAGGQVLINGNTAFGSNVVVEAGAAWVMNNNNSPTITLNGVLTNLGTVRSYSGNRNYTLSGNGRVENLGLWTTADIGAYYYYESWVLLPVNVPAGGTLSVDTNGRMAFGAGSSLTVAGTLQIGSNARLRLDKSSPARTVTFRAGNSLTGTGTLELDGDNQLVAEADLVAPVSINTYDSARVVVVGAYSIGGKPSVNGTLQAGAVTVLTNGTLNLANATVSGPMDVQAGGQVLINGNTAFGSNVVVEAGATWVMNNNNSPTVTLNGVLTNLGTMRSYSGNRNYTLNGSGRVENLGLWTTTDQGAYYYYESWVLVPVNVQAGGTFGLDVSGRLSFGSGSSLSVAGTLQITNSGRLRFDNSSPARTVAFLAGGNLAGTGTLELYGSNRLAAAADLLAPVAINTYDSAQVVVPGTYTIAANPSMSGTLQAGAIAVRTNSSLSLANASVSGPLDVQPGGQVLLNGNTIVGGNVLVEAGAKWVMNNNNSPTVTLNGVLTNLGTVLSYSGNRSFALQGSGWVENLASWTTTDVGAYYYYESRVLVPVDVPAGAAFSLGTGGRLAFGGGSSLRVAGTLQIGNNAVLRFDSSSPAHDLTLLPGAMWGGAGTTQLQGLNRAVIAGDVILGGGLLTLLERSSLAGTNLLTIASGATLRIDHSAACLGSITVDGTLAVASSGVTFTTTRGLTLDPSGTINNPGTIRAASFDNLGGTIVGNAPLTGVVPFTFNGVSPADGAVGQSLWLNQVQLQFSDALKASTFDTNSILFTNSLGQTPAYSVGTLANQGQALIQPSLPLQPGMAYTARVLPVVASASGAALVDTNGAALPAAGVASSFRAARLSVSTPVEGALAIAGLSIPVAVSYESGLGAAFFRFQLDANPPVTVPAGPTNVSAMLPVPADAVGGTLSIQASPDNTFARAFALAPIHLNIQPNAPLSFLAPANVVVPAGASSNLVIHIAATAPVSEVDFVSTNLPPSFVSVAARSFVTIGTNGLATVTLQLNPLQDAAGSYVITLRAVAQNGLSTFINVPITVLPNPALVATRWASPVSGNWSDASKWTAGLPGNGTVAVIDAVGTYTVTLDASVNASGLVLNHSNAVLNISGSRTINAPFELRAGLLTFNSGGTLTLNSPLVNLGAIKLPTGSTTFTLSGSGWVQNLGLWEFYRLSWDSESWVTLPVEVPIGGVLKLDDGGARLAFGAGSGLRAAGTVQLGSNARLRFDNSAPARDVALISSSVLSGPGILELDGSNRLVATADLDTTAIINHYDSSQAVVPGTYTLRSGSWVNGTVQAGAVVVATNSTLTLNNAAFYAPLDLQPGGQLVVNASSTFATNVLVEAGAIWNVNNTPTVTLNGVLTNLGTMKWPTGSSTFALQGSGRVENLGLWEFYRLSWDSESWVSVPVNVPAGGVMQLDDGGARVAFGAGSSLNLAGTLRLGSNARLRFDNSSPARTVTVLPGGVLSGTGILELDGANRLAVSADLDTTATINIYDTSQIVVPGTYTVRANDWVNGTVQAGGVVVTTNSTLTLNNATFYAPLDLQPGGQLVVNASSTFASNVLVEAGAIWNINNTPTVTLNGVLTNLGTLKWPTGSSTFALQGSGRVENLGLWEFYRLNWDSESWVYVPVNVSAGGVMQLDDGGARVAFGAGSSLNLAGTLRLGTNARLRFDNSSPARTLTLLTGGVLSGTGVLELDGANRLVASADLDTTAVINNYDSSQVVVPGTYTIRANNWINGTVQAGTLAVATNATLSLNNATINGLLDVQPGGKLVVNASSTFASNVLVEAGAIWNINNTPTVTLNGVLTNLGTMKWPTGSSTFALQGSGRVENLGLWEFYRLSWDSESWVYLPVNVPAGGVMQLDDGGARVAFGAGSSLKVAGTLYIGNNARLRLDNSSPVRAVTLLPSGILSGTGTLELDGANHLQVAGDLDTTVAVYSRDSSLIVSPGTYTIRGNTTLNSTLQAGAVVVATNGNLVVSGATLNAPVQVQAGGQMVNGGDVTCVTNVTVEAGAIWSQGNNGAKVTLSGVLTNRGTINWRSGYYTFTLQGSGRVENAGLWEVGGAGSGWYNESWVRMPVNVPVGGVLQLDNNARVAFGSGSSLAVAGAVQIGTNAVLRFDNSAPARDLTFLAGSVLSGAGAVELDGSNRMLVSGDLTSGVTINLHQGALLQTGGVCTAPINSWDSAAVQVAGTYVIGGNLSLSGSFQADAVVVATNGTLLVSGATLNAPVQVQAGGQMVNGGDVTCVTNVTVEAGAIWSQGNNGAKVTLSGVLTNRGTINWRSGYYTFTLQGSGRVENAGLWEVAGAGSGWYNESWVRMPVNVPVGGVLQLDNNARVAFGSGSSLAVGGAVQIGTNAVLRFDNSTPARDLTFLAGSVLSGAGTTQLEGANRVVVAGDLILGGGTLNFYGSSSLAGTNLLTIASGATLRLDHSTTFPGSLTVDGLLTLTSASITFDIGGTLTLDAGGVINNPGTIRAGAFVNNGGTITGNTPTIRSGVVLLRIAGLTLDGSAPQVLGLASGTSSASRSVTLDCRGLPGQTFVVESSTDLTHWGSLTAAPREVSPGRYLVTVTVPNDGQRLFRLRTAPVP